MKAEIEKGKKLLQSAVDCDDEGAEHYSPEAFDGAVEFLTMHADFLRQFGLELPVPSIGTGSGGSIDLHWKRASWELLVNVPSDGTSLASFYADNYGVQRIKGSVDPKTCDLGLAAWLMSYVFLSKRYRTKILSLCAHTRCTSMEPRSSPAFFRAQGGSMSVNWSKYASAQKTR